MVMTGAARGALMMSVITTKPAVYLHGKGSQGLMSRIQLEMFGCY